jgi:hypothetical protein
MDNVLQICNKYSIKPHHVNNLICDATGIGDILFRILAIKNEIITKPFYINLNYFTKPYYKMNSINQLEFRIKLILDIINYNNIDHKMIKFVFSNNESINEIMPYELIENYNLKFDDTTENTKDTIMEDYIIFHTKCRHNKNENYSILKENIKNFCKINKSKYKIIILGERIFPHTEEVEWHGITTVYNELLELKNNNDIIDKSIENIYSNLDYDNYKNDIKLIQNAKYNICFGLGGQLCTSAIFGKSTIVYCKINEWLNTNNFKKNNFYFTNIIDFFNLIKEKCFMEN